VELLRSLGITQPEPALHEAGVLVARSEASTRVQTAQDFVAAIARHRHWARPKLETVPA